MQRSIPILVACLLVGCGSSGASDPASENRPVADAVKQSSAVPKDAQGAASDEYSKLPADVRQRMPGGVLQPPKK